jgi:hypothetical protein
MAGSRSSRLDLCRVSIVLGAGARESLLDSRFDIAFRLTTNSSQL